MGRGKERPPYWAFYTQRGVQSAKQKDPITPMTQKMFETNYRGVRRPLQNMISTEVIFRNGNQIAPNLDSASWLMVI